jgi:hypothetical protein
MSQLMCLKGTNHLKIVGGEINIIEDNIFLYSSGARKSYILFSLFHILLFYFLTPALFLFLPCKKTPITG